MKAFENKYTIRLSVIVFGAIFILGISTTFISTRDVAGTSKKILSDEELNDNKYASIISNIEKIWSERFPYSNELGMIDSRTTYLFTREISSDNVILGKENWLFYNSSGTINAYSKTEDTMADYRGAYYHTKDEMDIIANEVIDVQSYLDKHKIKFSLLICPNKSSIYYEYMPETYERAESTRTDKLVEYLKKKDINIIYPKEQFLEDKDMYQLYYKYDSHWNKLGAYDAYSMILKSWNINNKCIFDAEVKEKNLSENYHHSAKADLAAMIGLRNDFFDDEIEYCISNRQIDWEKYEFEQEGGEYSHFFNEEARINKTVLLIGDSFQSALIPALMDDFSDVYVCFRRNYTVDMLERFCPNYVIVEWAERNSADVSKIKTIILGE